jgi:hypothetical protein
MTVLSPKDQRGRGKGGFFRPAGTVYKKPIHGSKITGDCSKNTTVS